MIMINCYQSTLIQPIIKSAIYNPQTAQISPPGIIGYDRSIYWLDYMIDHDMIDYDQFPVFLPFLTLELIK